MNNFDDLYEKAKSINLYSYNTIRLDELWNNGLSYYLPTALIHLQPLIDAGLATDYIPDSRGNQRIILTRLGKLAYFLTYIL
jgi:hypothetical protein